MNRKYQSLFESLPVIKSEEIVNAVELLAEIFDKWKEIEPDCFIGDGHNNTITGCRISGRSGYDSYWRINIMTYLKGVSTLEYQKELCTGCGMCKMVCPYGVFQIQNEKAEIIEKDNCM